MHFSEPRSSIPEERLYRTRILGGATSDPTKEVGQAITVTRSGVGVYLYTFRENPGVFVGVGGLMLGDATPSNVKGYTVTRDEYDSTNGVYSIALSVWDASNAAADLAATSYLDVTFVFAATGAPLT